MTKKALIMIDLQNDFCAGGSLAVPGGEDVIPLVNQLQQHFDLILATQDWHPHDHTSFAANHPKHSVGDVIEIEHVKQILWPTHCVQATQGAAFHADLHTQKINKVFYKGVDKNIDSYSAFFDNAHQRSTSLADYLRAENVTDVYLIGLATDYCVKFSALDAAQLGFNVFVIKDACRAVELREGDADAAFADMQYAGVKLIHSTVVLTTQ